jgi:hypothetical protein
MKSADERFRRAARAATAIARKRAEQQTARVLSDALHDSMHAFCRAAMRAPAVRRGSSVTLTVPAEVFDRLHKAAAKAGI